METESKGLTGATYRQTTSTDSKDLSKVLFGALAGAAVGSIIGVVFTEKGIETRKRVGERSRNIANNLKDKVADLKENIADKYAATKEGAANLIEKGKQKVGMSTSKAGYKSSTGTDLKHTGSKVLIGALAASVAGTIIWSFATEKGTETRKRVGKGSKNIASNLKEKLTNIADEVADKYQAAKEGAADLVERTKQQNNMSSGNNAYRGTTSADTLEG